MQKPVFFGEGRDQRIPGALKSPVTSLWHERSVTVLNVLISGENCD